MGDLKAWGLSAKRGNGRPLKTMFNETTYSDAGDSRKGGAVAIFQPGSDPKARIDILPSPFEREPVVKPAIQPVTRPANGFAVSPPLIAPPQKRIPMRRRIRGRVGRRACPVCRCPACVCPTPQTMIPASTPAASASQTPQGAECPAWGFLRRRNPDGSETIVSCAAGQRVSEMGLYDYSGMGDAATEARLRNRVRRAREERDYWRGVSSSLQAPSSGCGCSTRPVSVQNGAMLPTGNQTLDEHYGPFTLFEWAVLGGIAFLVLKKR